MSVSIFDAMQRVAARQEALFGKQRSAEASEFAPMLVGTGLTIDDVRLVRKLLTRTGMLEIRSGAAPADVLASVAFAGVLVGIEFAHMEAADVEASVAE